ncbi:hypothetical protein [Thiomonas sp. FB-Cd]|uniref:hypothetical protein n=1 Tax=Thiomonas sp. FB-Cd TaxID=1158292 RepID=UPI000AC920AE|nr:hypothetical protein [Thiomonas sp. FB-Cd]
MSQSDDVNPVGPVEPWAPVKPVSNQSRTHQEPQRKPPKRGSPEAKTAPGGGSSASGEPESPRSGQIDELA